MNYVSNLLIIKTNCVCRKDFKRNEYKYPPNDRVFMIVPFCLKIFFAFPLEINNPFCFTNIVINIIYFQDLKK